MTRDELMEVAKRLSRQRLLMENLRMMNVPADLDERVDSDARYMIENDKLYELEREYAAASKEYGSLDAFSPRRR